MLKTVLAFDKIEEQKAFRLLSTTSVDVGNFEEVKELNDCGIEPVKLARLILAMRFIKIF